jgi:hypothetical protein
VTSADLRRIRAIRDRLQHDLQEAARTLPLGNPGALDALLRILMKLKSFERLVTDEERKSTVKAEESS